MNPYTTTEHILNSHWQLDHCEFNAEPTDWHYTQPLMPGCIKVWEVAHYEPGVVGVYAAHDPYCEYYAVVNCTTAHSMSTWQTFEGIAAASKAAEHAQTMGVNLELTSSWSNLIKCST